MQNLLGILLCIIGMQCFGQALRVEKAFNESHYQAPIQMIVDEVDTYLLIEEISDDGYTLPLYLYKLDEDGETLFCVEIEHESGVKFHSMEMILAEDGGVYIAGNAISTCDVLSPTPFIQKFSDIGNLEWAKTVVPDMDYEWFLSGLSLVEETDLSQKIVISVSLAEEYHDTSKIYLLDTDGIYSDSISVYNNRFEHYQLIEDEELIAAKEDSLFSFNFEGDLMLMREFSESISELALKGDTLFVLTRDSLAYLNSDFSTITALTIDPAEDFKNMRLYDDEFYIHASSPSAQSIYEVGYDLMLTFVTLVPYDLPDDHISHFSNERLSVAIPFELTDYQAVRYLNFSASHTVDEVPNRTDIGIIDLQVLDTEFVGADEVNLYTKVLVKNFGDNELTSCRINHFIRMGLVCASSYYSEFFTGLSIAPGNSEWIELGWTGERPIADPFGGGPGDPEFNYCFFTSYANELCDLNISNDEFCRDLGGQLDLKTSFSINPISIYPNPFTSVFTIKSTSAEFEQFVLYDMLGQTVLSGQLINSEIDGSQLPAGVYTIELANDNGESINQLLVKE